MKNKLQKNSQKQKKKNNHHRLRIQYKDDKERVIRSFSCEIIIKDDKLYAR